MAGTSDIKKMEDRKRKAEDANLMIGDNPLPYVDNVEDTEEVARKEDGMEDDCKPAAVPTNMAASTARVVTTSALQQARVAYADAFLAKCRPISKKQADSELLEPGVYIGPWLKKSNKTSERFCVRDIIECRYCGQSLGQVHADSRFAFDHKVKCFSEMREKREELYAKASKRLSTEGSDAVGATLDHRCAESKSFSDKIGDIRNLYSSYFENPWIKTKTEADLITKQYQDACREGNTLDLLAVMKYRAPRFESDWELSYFYCAYVDPHPSSRNERPECNFAHSNELDFGPHAIQASLIPSSETKPFFDFFPCVVQVHAHTKDTLNTRAWINNNSRQVVTMYTKNGAWSYNHNLVYDSDDDDDDDDDEPCRVPFPICYAVPHEGVNADILSRESKDMAALQHGGPGSDVWFTHNHSIAKGIRPVLDDLAMSTNDCPLPRYQMIIDPNQFIYTQSDGNRLWVPSEFDISKDGRHVHLVGGDRAHWMGPKLIDAVASPILTEALPLLAKLTKPHLLLEGQRLQVVVKAQSITVPKKTPYNDTPEYVGLWHVDGEHEAVAAVVLYYYDVDESLKGGNMEFLDRRPIGVLGDGDTEHTPYIPTQTLRQALRSSPQVVGPPGDKDFLAAQDRSPYDQPEISAIPNCSIPIASGTLLVFSNYQMAHRVLRMVNTSSERAASRKFVALFLLDPAADRLVPSRCHLAKPFLFQRALGGECALLPKDAQSDSFPAEVIQLILEYMGIVPSLKERRKIRNEMLRSQLQPKYALGGSQTMVYSTGNGCHTMIGWINSLLANAETNAKKETRHRFSNPFDRTEKRINALNYPPNQIGRGLSETLSIPSDDLEFAPFLDTLQGRNDQVNYDLKWGSEESDCW